MLNSPKVSRVKPAGFQSAGAEPSWEDDQPSGGWLKAFEGLEDPRRDGRYWHPLLSIIGISLLAVLCGAEHWEEIEVYGRSKQKWLESFLDLPFGIPSHDGDSAG